MAWINTLVFVIIGIVIGFIIARLTMRDNSQQKDLKKELEKSRYELEQYRQELVDHFAQSAELLDNISRDYSKLYQHMANTSAELMPNLPEQDNPFAKRISKISEVTEESSSSQEPPRDYSDGASGLLKDQKETSKAS
ncbi:MULTISPECIES: Z-ring associated protein ZapG [Grimontia]|uniref:Z-ring associated protein G n=1 Tax=Grimontia marina TaxID=646534 RepID=A0A128EWG0_9GAMM|nr:MULTISPECIES: Z-ring associated protein ZapG [Grimontia]WRV97036.1 Z-ring associated protein ZapG [Grimontia sp. NTOU-MAR1]CZF78331.1 Inner membrane protein YhcB [Grimontia marina]